MGTGSKTGHQPATITPAMPLPSGSSLGDVPAGYAAGAPTGGSPLPAFTGPGPQPGSSGGVAVAEQTAEISGSAAAGAELQHASQLVTHLTDLHETLLAGPPLHGDELTAWYDDLAATAGKVPPALAAALAAGASPQQISDMQDAATDAATKAVQALDSQQLLHLAEVHGFQHPELVTGPPGAVSPLSAWLNPTSPDGSFAKQLIQAKAIERYENLTAAAAGYPPPSPAPAAYGFSAQHAKLVAALAHAKATVADVPPRLDPATVTASSFGPGQSAALGGVHSKTIHDGPGDRKWLFKPDTQAGGARAHAEAAASAILHAGGVPSVPVYVVPLGGKTGAIQPLVKNATALPSSPAKWSQADVDAIVRYHVAAWVAGDHDGNPENVLRTAGGGMIPIDQGQAFKFFGSDKLDIGYHPNSSHGTARLVFHQAYEAHLSGTLGEGVKVNPAAAHPVIKAYESIPDTQWRAILHDTAHQGAAHNVAWVPAMRAQAAKKHGISASAVSTAQIADAFLDHACERKNRLRADFADFYASKMKLPGAAALRHIPGGRR